MIKERWLSRSLTSWSLVVCSWLARSPTFMARISCTELEQAAMLPRQVNSWYCFSQEAPPLWKAFTRVSSSVQHSGLATIWAHTVDRLVVKESSETAIMDCRTMQEWSRACWLSFNNKYVCRQLSPDATFTADYLQKGASTSGKALRAPFSNPYFNHAKTCEACSHFVNALRGRAG